VLALQIDHDHRQENAAKRNQRWIERNALRKFFKKVFDIKYDENQSLHWVFMIKLAGAINYIRKKYQVSGHLEQGIY
jgi:hypothetical protein